jgi:hypothetical protein
MAAERKNPALSAVGNLLISTMYWVDENRQPSGLPEFAFSQM